MAFQWLKSTMPRRLYARAALILILPVVTLQLVVSVVFIKRHFEDVTAQMAHTAALELQLILTKINASTTRETAVAKVAPLIEGLDIELRFLETPPKRFENKWSSIDLTAPYVIKMMSAKLPALRSIALPDRKKAELYLQTELGILYVYLDRRRLSATNAHQLFVNMVFFGILMTVIASIYMRNQLRPVTRLARAAEAFGRGYNVSYQPAGALEVRAAGTAFLDMRSRIERQIEQRTIMLSSVSHDLRTPLTRLKLGLSLLRGEDRAPLERDVEDMRRLLDEFMNFARGATEVEAEKTDPKVLLERIVADANRSGKTVTLGTCEGVGMVMLRQLAIRRAVENLLANAMRYGTAPEVYCEQTEKMLSITVEDAGPGIPAELRAEAIKPFVRLDPARNQDQGSSVGLGLSITADIARAHGGFLKLSSSTRLGGLRADIIISF